MESDIDKLCSFIDRSSTTQSIVGGMVEIVEMQDFAFMGTWRYNQREQNEMDTILFPSKSDKLTCFKCIDIY